MNSHVEALDLPWCKRQFSEGNLMDLAILNLFSTMLEIYSLTMCRAADKSAARVNKVVVT